MVFSFMRMSNLDKVRQLSWKDRRLLLQSVLLLPLIHLGLIILGYARLRGWMERSTPRKLITQADLQTASLERARQVAHLVSIAAQHNLYKAGCLRRSLLIWWLLRKEGIQTEIHFGVRMVNGKLEAHAWVEYNAAVVNDAETIRLRYQPLYQVLPRTERGL